tara:strand:+ start:10331 stop:10669 length:339 start_codon:yes stop_codon:yes gene_type:complete
MLNRHKKEQFKELFLEKFESLRNVSKKVVQDSNSIFNIYDTEAIFELSFDDAPYENTLKDIRVEVKNPEEVEDYLRFIGTHPTDLRNKVLNEYGAWKGQKYMNIEFLERITP